MFHVASEIGNNFKYEKGRNLKIKLLLKARRNYFIKIVIGNNFEYIYKIFQIASQKENCFILLKL